MTIQIEIVSEQQQREEIYSFRYSIYVEEMGRTQLHADREKKRICEPLDDKAILFAAYENGEIVGTSRVNYSKDSDFGYYHDFYEIDKIGQYHSQRTCITTKFMVKSEYRKGTLAVRLVASGYANALKAGIRYNFIDVNPHLINFFMRLGYRFHKDAHHPEYGDVTIMVFDLEDINHLESIESPLRKEYYSFMKNYSLATA